MIQRMTGRTSDRWRKYEPIIRNELEMAEIEMIPRNLSEILAKINTGESDGGRGVFFIGPTGTGKSLRLEFASEMFGIEMVSAMDLVRQLQNAENEIEEKEIVRCQPCRYQTPPHYHDLIIDDLGIEPLDVLVYGTRRELIIEAIYNRYKVFTDAGRQWKTHFTSNLTKEEIRARYGERIWSRLNEMVTFVSLVGKDRRIG